MRLKFFILFMLSLLTYNLTVFAQGREFKPRKFPNKPKNTPNTKPKEVKENDISIEDKMFYCDITLRNFGVGKIEHPRKRDFISIVKRKIQSIRQDKVIDKIKIIGWADGNPNPGINISTFNLKFDCLNLCPNSIIDDEKLAELRGCQLKQSLMTIFMNLSISVEKDIEKHDELDNTNMTGEFRKVIIKIVYK